MWYSSRGVGYARSSSSGTTVYWNFHHKHDYYLNNHNHLRNYQHHNYQKFYNIIIIKIIAIIFIITTTIVITVTITTIIIAITILLNCIVGGEVQTGSTRHVGHSLAYCTCPGWLWGWRIWWNEWQGKPKYSEKIYPDATLCTTNPTWPDPGLNPGRRGGKPATKRFSYGAAITILYLSNICGPVHESQESPFFQAIQVPTE
jgi:hypothetical protein